MFPVGFYRVSFLLRCVSHSVNRLRRHRFETFRLHDRAVDARRNGSLRRGSEVGRMFDTGATGFMIVCAMLVFLMTPGLAFFYGGLSRRKNVVNTMIMSFAVLGIVGVTWVIAGWSFAYGGDGSLPFFGGFDQLGLAGLVGEMVGEAEGALSHDAYPRVGGCGVPGGVRHDHGGDHHRVAGGPHEVRRRRLVRGHLVACRLRAARPYGVGRRRISDRRHDRRARFRRRRCGAHQLGPHRIGAVSARGQAPRVRHDELPSA